MCSRILLVFSFAALFAVLHGSRSGAQVISGDLVGTVLDKTGAVVPGATIEAMNTETGVKYDTRASETGAYHFSNLPVGNHNVSASASNFATTVMNLNGDSAGDRPIFNPSGVKNTGSGVTPLCTSAVAVCPATVSDAIDNHTGVVGYLADHPNAQSIQAGYGALSNVGRSTLQLDPINDVDLSALKRINMTERFKVEFRASATNLFNHRQYVGGFLNDVAPPNPVFTGTQRNMLLANNPAFNDPSAVFSNNPRTMQLVLKFIF